MIYNMKAMGDDEQCKVVLSCAVSYLYYHDAKYYRKHTDYLMKRLPSHEKAIRWFVSNSARAFRLGAKGFYVSLSSNSYTSSKQGIGYRKVVSLLEWLEKEGYVDIYKGYVKEWGQNKQIEKTIPSCVVFSDKWINVWQGERHAYNLWKELESDVVVIRDRETKENKPTRGHRGVTQMKQSMERYNGSLKGADITFDGTPIADIMFSRIFSEDLEHGGRLYAVGGGVQTIPSELRRSKIKIDGEPVAEIDFCAMHPNICYQLMHNGGESVYDALGEDFDPYMADLSFITVNEARKQYWERLTGKKANPLRKLSKLAILIGMNAKDEQSAVCALSSKVLADRRKPESEQELYAIDSTIPVKRVFDAIVEHNSYIAHHFFNDSGMMLQNIDSKIMMDVISTLIQKGITVLGYHDSCMVKESVANVVEDVMMQSWVNVLQDSTYCKTEIK